MNCHFISFESYPDGGAASNRHLALFKGLDKLGVDVSLYSCLHSSNYECNFCTIYSVKKNSENKLFKYVNALLYIFNLCAHRFSQKKNDNVIIYLGTSSIFLLPIMLYSKLMNVSLYHERTELPELMVGKNFISRLDYYIYRNFLIQLFDGVFVINNKLKSALEKFPGVDSKKIHILNMMVDLSRFEKICVESNLKMKTVN